MSKQTKTPKASNEMQLYIEVLQNGEVIDRLVRPMNKSGRVRLSAGSDAELNIPLYPLPQTHLVYRRTGSGRGEIVVPQDWEGFLTSLGEIHDLKSSHSHAYRFPVGHGDYGSLQFRDLNLLFKIKSELSSFERKVKRDRSYGGSVMKLLVRSKNEWSIMAIALAASLIIWGGFSAGLLVRPDDLPKSYSDLEPRYVLPFMSADHLRSIPEANQKNLDRRNYIKSTLEYYRAFSQMVLGYDVQQEQFMFPNSMAAFQSYYNKQMDQVQEKVRGQQHIDQQIANESAVALIRIPTVRGTSATQDLARLMRTLSDYHKGLQENLRERRKFKNTFIGDKNYDMTLHANIPPLKTVPTAEDISFKGNDDDETTMYKTAQELAAKAERAHKFIEARKTQIAISEDQLLPSVVIKDTSNLASFLPPENFQTDSAKIDNIAASQFNTTAKQKIKEPLTGELDPALVSKTIDKRKFELQLCYELALRRNQKTNGKMEFSWRIDSRGQISDLKLLHSTIDDKRMVNCVQQKIATWKFPRPRRGSIKIKYPFSFTPRRG